MSIAISQKLTAIAPSINRKNINPVMGDSGNSSSEYPYFAMSQDEDTIARIQTLEIQYENLTIALAAEHEINQRQAAQLIHSSRSAQRLGESLTMGLLGAIAFATVILTGVKVELGWASFEMPADLFQQTGIVGGVSFGAKYLLDKKREQDEGGDSRHLTYSPS
jgi:hypothetical protein